MSRVRHALSFAAAAIALTASRSASADERVAVNARGAHGAILEERLTEGGEWSTLCSLPCIVMAVPDPGAEHRVVDGEHGSVPVFIRGAGRDLVTIDYRRPRVGSASTAAIVVGSTIGAVGMSTLALGGLLLLMTIGDCPDCPIARTPESRESAGLMMLAGAGIAAVGGLVIFVGRERRPATVETRTFPVEARAPTWRSVEAPALPRRYATILDLRF